MPVTIVNSVFRLCPPVPATIHPLETSELPDRAPNSLKLSPTTIPSPPLYVEWLAGCFCRGNGRELLKSLLHSARTQLLLSSNAISTTNRRTWPGNEAPSLNGISPSPLGPYDWFPLINRHSSFTTFHCTHRDP